MGLTQSVLSKNICFYKYADNSGPNGSPDRILTTFYVKLHEKQMSYLPRPETHKQLHPDGKGPQTTGFFETFGSNLAAYYLGVESHSRHVAKSEI